MTVKIKTKILDKFAESACDVRLSLQNGVEGRTGYVVLAPKTNGRGEPIDSYMHYHMSDLGLVPLRVRHITPFSQNEGSKGLIRIDSGYKEVFG